MEKYIYVDNSSTTKLSQRALSQMLPYLRENYGNASTLYELGRKSKEAIEKARCNIAKCINAKPEEIYFTSGGTESDNLAIFGIAHKCKGKHIITSKFEHLAILNACNKLEKEGYDITYVDVEENGVINPQKVKEAIRKDTCLISIMYVNNEIGTIQNIDEIAKIARENNIIFHTDAVQALPHIKIDASHYDLLSASAHKFNGPKGVGFIYIRNGIEIEPLLYGGHQEKCIRPSTENVAGIVGMSEALSETYENLDKNNDIEKKLRDYLLNNLLKEIEGIEINGDLENRIASNINFSINGIDASELMVFLELNKICVSTGSACNSSSKTNSHVLKAIGKDRSSIRITLSKENTFEEMDYIIYTLKNAIEIIKTKDKKITKI